MPDDKNHNIYLFGTRCLTLAIIFLLLLIVGSCFYPLTPDRFLIVFFLALITSIGFGVIGGTAKADGKIPIFPGFDPISFGMTGGSAFFFIILVFGYCFYVSPNQFSENEKYAHVQYDKPKTSDQKYWEDLDSKDKKQLIEQFKEIRDQQSESSKHSVGNSNQGLY